MRVPVGLRRARAARRDHRRRDRRGQDQATDRHGRWWQARVRRDLDAARRLEIRLRGVQGEPALRHGEGHRTLAHRGLHDAARMHPRPPAAGRDEQAVLGVLRGDPRRHIDHPAWPQRGHRRRHDQQHQGNATAPGQRRRARPQRHGQQRMRQEDRDRGQQQQRQAGTRRRPAAGCRSRSARRSTARPAAAPRRRPAVPPHAARRAVPRHPPPPPAAPGTARSAPRPPRPPGWTAAPSRTVRAPAPPRRSRCTGTA